MRSAFPGPEGAFFCCEGCREVHALLAAERWAPYRDMMEQGGKRAPRAWVGEAFRALLASLDDPAALASLGRWEGQRHAVTLRARDVTCAGCGFLVESLLRESPGVGAFEVDFLHGEVYLEYDAGKTSLRAVLEGLARFGYRLEPVDGAGEAKPEPDRGLLYRIAVAAFCFMNSMAFAAAVYSGIAQGMAPGWARAFGLAGFLIALPAVLYSAQPFYQGAWRALRARRFNVDSTVTLGIAVAFLASAHAAWTGRGGNFSDSLSGLVFFLLAGRWAVRRFEAGLALEGRWFERLAPGHVTVRRGEGLARVPAESVREGEIVVLGAGEYAPVDGALDGDEAWMDTSLLTGESRAARLRKGDPVFAGYLNLKGRTALRAAGSRGQTRIAGLRRDLSALAAGRGPVPDGSGPVAMRFTLAVAACAIAGFLWHLRAGLPHALETAASVFIVSCACALALAVPINRGLGLKRARGLGFHFRAQAALEALRGVRCVLFDKTGTLTFTRRSVAGWDWCGQWRDDAPRQDAALRSLRAATAGSLHPVSLSVQAALEILPTDGLRAAQARELPHFGIVARVPEADGRDQVICLCKYGAWGSPGPFAEMGYAIPEGPLPAADACVFIDGTLAALIRFTEEIKPEAARLIAALEARGLGVALLSGDNPEKVRAFAEACGIREWRASLAPEAKRAAAEEYRRRYGRLLAVGDGFNDSLLFGTSDLAMAVSGGAADRMEGVDILSAGDRPMALAALFALADGVSRGVRRGYWASGCYNAAAITAALAGWVTPLFAAALMPISGLSLCLLAWLSIPRRP